MLSQLSKSLHNFFLSRKNNTFCKTKKSVWNEEEQNHVSKQFPAKIADMDIRMTFHLRNIYCMSQKLKDIAFIIFQHMWQMP